MTRSNTAQRYSRGEQRAIERKIPTSKNVRQRKFILALSILAGGMLVAILWYSFQWYTGSIYPYDTFLFIPLVRFSDFTNTFWAALRSSPYLKPGNPYPPAAYVLLWPLNGVPFNLLVFLLLGIIPNIWLLFRAMRPVFLGFTQSILGRWSVPANPRFNGVHRFLVDNVAGIFLTLVLLVSCEPFLMCLDRANIELWVIFMVGMSLYYFSKARFYASIAWLVLPICMKIYPCVLLALFLRRKKLHFIVLAVVASIIVTALCYGLFAGGILTNYLLNKSQLELNADDYVCGNLGLSETASPWNLYRSVVMTLHALQTGTFFDPWWNWYPLIPQFRNDLIIYSKLVAAVAVFITIFVILIEKDTLRRMAVLLLFMVLASPAGAEHKITHIGTALVAFILLRNFRRGDYWVTALLAFTLIPKKEYIFECFGPTDSGVADVSSAIVLNPLAMLIALALLCWFGLRQFDAKWSTQRLKNLRPAWMRKKYRFVWQ